MFTDVAQELPKPVPLMSVAELVSAAILPRPKEYPWLSHPSRFGLNVLLAHVAGQDSESDN